VDEVQIASYSDEKNRQIMGKLELRG